MVERIEKLTKAQNIWLATTRQDCKPHLVPIWFVWMDEKFYICTARSSLKARNLTRHPAASLALEDGIEPVVAECTARLIEKPYPPEITTAFFQKYEWKIDGDTEYDIVIEFTPHKWLMG